MMDFSFDNEQLQESLLDLLRTNELGSQREMHSLALLDVIQEIGRSQSTKEVIDTLFHGLQIITGHQEFAILEPCARQQGYWSCTLSSNPNLELSFWQQDQVFDRALQGEPILLFKPDEVVEFESQETEILELAGCALIFAVTTNLKQRIILLLQQDKVFNYQHKEAIERLRPIAEQRLQNLEFDQKLYDMVAQRSEALKVSQHRMASFIDMSSDWFWEVDDELRFSYVANPNHPKGEQFHEILMGKSILELRSPKEKKRLNKWFNVTRLLQQRKVIEQFEVEFQLPGQKPTWVKICAQPYYKKQGIFAGYRGVAANITDDMSQRIELSQQLQQLAQTRAEPEQQAQSTRALECKSKILLVDDCKSTQMITQLMLINLGYGVTVAGSGTQALALPDLKAYSLILMDLEMPDLSGEEVCREMRQLGVEAPILALTGTCYQARHQHTKEAGMNDFIEKPVRLNLLKAKLESFLEERV